MSIVHCARSPFELIETLLLVFMKLPSGVISVIRYFVDPSLKNPAIANSFTSQRLVRRSGSGCLVLPSDAVQLAAGPKHRCSRTWARASILAFLNINQTASETVVNT
jgi:hypothetical protein